MMLDVTLVMLHAFLPTRHVPALCGESSIARK